MQTQRFRNRERGFTLVELMVVIVILGGLIAIVGPNIWQAMGEGQRGQAETQMSNIAQSVNMYMLQNRGKLPNDLDELTQENPSSGEPYIERIPRDPWDGRYELKQLDKRKFEILCAGADEQMGTEDDIVWPKPEEE